METILSVLRIEILIPWLLSMVLGIFVGAMPGLTATMAVALIVPLTFHTPPIVGLAMILGVSFTSIFAGDIPATFLRVPGTPASGAAVLDGYEMNKQGKGPLAIALDLICSTLGGLIGVLILITVSPVLASFALKFTHFEYFWLALLGLSMSAVITKGSTMKGLISMVGGLILSTIGLDISTGYPRFSFGSTYLMGGINFIPVMIGLFGISEVLRSISVTSLEDMGNAAVTTNVKADFRSVGTVMARNKRLILQSSLIGTLIGALPGAGADIAAWVSYGMAKKTSKKPETFGSGSEEGVIAPTTANNAALGGTWIPALVFGIPGDSITAIVLGAMMMYGLKPGPLVFQGDRVLVNQIFTVAVISQFFLLILGYLGIRAFTWFFKFPRNIVLAGITIFSLIGAYAMRSSVFDIGIVLVFGILGYLMERVTIPLPPFILGLILGPMIEENLRIGLVKTSGNFWPFFTRPISAFFAATLILIFLYEPIKLLIRKKLARRTNL
ncbi:MAG TPA: tripartite tricarboxylate transporter permease [Spirochaetales bacterium]|nr:tripartite tricarboxylate transporter permease [Spirochaetales bacterium]HOV38464.1 tripartite tricarboxylate transporter permease [Spirochaetales bacterium]